MKERAGLANGRRKGQSPKSKPKTKSKTKTKTKSKTADLRFTFTVHASRFTIHDSRDPPMTSIVRLVAILSVIATGQVNAQQPTGAAPPQGPGAQTPTQGQGAGRRGPARPRPYAQVVTERAKSDDGAITIHQVEDR